MAQKTMYTTIIGDYMTTLTAPFAAGIDDVVHVRDTTFLPVPPNTATIKVPEQLFLVTIRYTGKTLTSLTGVTLVQGEPAAAMTTQFEIGSELSKPLAQDDVQSIQDNIRDIASTQDAKVDKQFSPTLAGQALVVGTDGIVTTGTFSKPRYDAGKIIF